MQGKKGYNLDAVLVVGIHIYTNACVTIWREEEKRSQVKLGEQSLIPHLVSCLVL